MTYQRLAYDDASPASEMTSDCRAVEAAREAGIAECTPNLRASYDAAQTTLRNPGQPTITGLPRNSGRSRCSTDA